MSRTMASALAASLLIAACGGGQTQPTEAEDALGNEYQPAAPSPGGEPADANGADPAASGENAVQ